MNKPIIVRGGGDLATGTIALLVRCGYDVLVLETDAPTAIRTQVSFSQAMYDGQSQVEEIVCQKADSLDQALELLKTDHIAILADPLAKSVDIIQPDVLIDAIMAKKNLGTTRAMAPVTIALGPGFEAGVDVDYVIETKRGHNLGRVYTEGSAAPNTGIPGVIGGYGKERVIHAPAYGILRNKSKIGDVLEKDDPVAVIETAQGNIEVRAPFHGLLRGILPDGFEVFEGLKMADLDPRIEEQKNCSTISDKARTISAGVIQAMMQGLNGHDLR